jgi:hypothetical protein
MYTLHINISHCCIIICPLHILYNAFFGTESLSPRYYTTWLMLIFHQHSKLHLKPTICCLHSIAKTFHDYLMCTDITLFMLHVNYLRPPLFVRFLHTLNSYCTLLHHHVLFLAYICILWNMPSPHC